MLITSFVGLIKWLFCPTKGSPGLTGLKNGQLVRLELKKAKLYIRRVPLKKSHSPRADLQRGKVVLTSHTESHKELTNGSPRSRQTRAQETKLYSVGFTKA